MPSEIHDMYLLRKLFGEILPFRMDHRRGGIQVKGGLAHDDDFFEAEHIMLYQTDDGRLEARIIYARDVPDGLHFSDSGSAVWFGGDLTLELRVEVPNGFHYSFKVRMLAAPDFFLNDAGRPERHPPPDDSVGTYRYLVEIVDNQWWASDERSPGREWHFSVNDLPILPPLKDSKKCRRNSAPGVYPGTYFTCTLNDTQYDSEQVEYWFSYELESSIDRVNSFRDKGSFVIDKNQYRFSFGRTDKQELDQREGRRIVGLWEYLLGFCSGAFRTVDIIIGYNDTGGWSYAELPQPLAKQFPCKFTWFPQGWPTDFPAFACQFLSRFQSDYDEIYKDGRVPTHFYDPALPFQQGLRAPIPILDGYLRAAGLDLPHDALNASFATLEAVVKEHLGRSDRDHLHAGEISSLLRERGIPPVERRSAYGSFQNSAWRSPEEVVGLQERPVGATSWTVLPKYRERGTAQPDDSEGDIYGIVNIKAWRNKRASHFDAHAGGGTFYDILNYSQMALEYLELVILQLVGYNDQYRSRTGMFNEAVKLVPWARALEYGVELAGSDAASPKDTEQVADC